MRFALVYVGDSVERVPKIERILCALRKRDPECVLVTLTKRGCHAKGGGAYCYDHKFRWVKYLRYLYGLSAITVKLLNKDIGYVYAINPFAGIVVWLVSRIKGLEYCYETLEIFCGTSYIGRNRFSRVLMYLAERTIMSRASVIVTQDKYRLRFLRRFYRLKNKKWIYLLNVPSNQLSREGWRRGGVKGEFIVSYCGVIIEGRFIEEVIRAVGGLSEEVKLVLAGEVSAGYKSRLLRLAESVGVKGRMAFTGRVGNPELNAIMMSSHCTFALYDHSCINNRFCSPNKVFDALNNGVSVIATGSYLVRDVLKRSGCGVILDSVDSETIRSAIIKIQKSVGGKECGVNRGGAVTYSWGGEEKKLLEVLPRS